MVISNLTYTGSPDTKLEFKYTLNNIEYNMEYFLFTSELNNLSNILKITPNQLDVLVSELFEYDYSTINKDNGIKISLTDVYLGDKININDDIGGVEDLDESTIVYTDTIDNVITNTSTTYAIKIQPYSTVFHNVPIYGTGFVNLDSSQIALLTFSLDGITEIMTARLIFNGADEDTVNTQRNTLIDSFKLIFDEATATLLVTNLEKGVKYTYSNDRDFVKQSDTRTIISGAIGKDLTDTEFSLLYFNPFNWYYNRGDGFLYFYQATDALDGYYTLTQNPTSLTFTNNNLDGSISNQDNITVNINNNGNGQGTLTFPEGVSSGILTYNDGTQDVFSVYVDENKDNNFVKIDIKVFGDAHVDDSGVYASQDTNADSTVHQCVGVITYSNVYSLEGIQWRGIMLFQACVNGNVKGMKIVPLKCNF